MAPKIRPLLSLSASFSFSFHAALASFAQADALQTAGCAFASGMRDSQRAREQMKMLGAKNSTVTPSSFAFSFHAALTSFVQADALQTDDCTFASGMRGLSRIVSPSDAALVS